MPRRSPYIALFLFFLIYQTAVTAAPDESNATAADAKARRAKTGLAQRTPWTSSKIQGSPEPPSPYMTQRVFAGLDFNRPVEMVAIPGTDRLVVVEVKGTIYSFKNDPRSDSDARDEFANLREIHPEFHQVYGLTFHPNYPRERYCFISYVLTADTPDGTRVSRFRVTDTDPPRVDLGSEEIIITWISGGHNGAHLQFGPDRCLYISTGDAGNSFPPDGRNTGQKIDDLLASVLRIDVGAGEAPATSKPSGSRLYEIPADNPFVKLPGARGEVWAYGFRNPWKMCFDPKDGSLWVGDVGWEMWELLYRVQPGGNYGWSLVEGRQAVHQERQRGPTPILPPTVEHSHTEARSITGGYFYAGERLPELKGAYIYGDYVTGKVWALWHKSGQITRHEELYDTSLAIVSFGLDQDGELYIVDYAGGIHRLIPNPRRAATRAFPERLSQTGLFVSVVDEQPAPGVIPYSINAEPWADGAKAKRWVAVPGFGKLGVFDSTNVQIGYIAGDWKFPSDSVLVKTLSIELEPGRPASRRRIETQLLHYDQDTWKAYNYIWNEEQSDAELAPNRTTTTTLKIADREAPGGVRRQTWTHVSRTECLVCHTTRAGSIHGFKLPQLLRDQHYGSVIAPQVDTLTHIGFFEKDPAPSQAWPDPKDETADLAARARSYLHVNCAHCHRRGGGGTAAFDIRTEYELSKTGLLDQRPTQGTFDMLDAKVVASGDPFRSVMLYRMAKLGRGRMPHLGSNVVDQHGVQLILDWIANLESNASQESLSVTAQRSRQSEILKRVTNGALTEEGAWKKDLVELLSSPSGAMQVVQALDESSLSKAVARAAVQQGVTHENPVVRDLFERYVAEEDRTQRLGSVVDVAAILKLQGDSERGRKLFLESTLQCRNCHRLENAGKALGPDLTDIGKKLNRHKLLESILEPSKTIDPKFVTYLIETRQGRVYSGLLVERLEDKVVLQDAAGKKLEVPGADIERMAPQQKSLMPELLLRDLTANQVADLLEFLARRQ